MDKTKTTPINSKQYFFYHRKMDCWYREAVIRYKNWNWW